ncbi:unnamed protein product [Rhizoctonia solani]|uniref:NAD-dependent epimerase/dehydratase domain-containing protein n=1 Tax=Rhizoctonia solani TaxID=456999 RepID=A0A8H2XTF2_9AGAM|nr:unnamed protein product [Rhizoctonia solani]
MPSISAPARFLVTGVNGYVGAHVAKDLLDRGFIVVGTVRSSVKGGDIAKYFKHYGDRFSYVVAQDMSEPGAFDSIINTGNFDGVAHTAAPIPSSAAISATKGPPKDMFNAAIEGMLNVLESIQNYGHSVKRLIFTSSTLAALQSEPGVVHNETHWNDEVVKHVQERGEEVTDLERYMASKCLSERAAWKFMEDNKNRLAFDLVTVLPTAIIGAPVNDDMPHGQLESSNRLFDGLKSFRSDSQLLEIWSAIVHVKDVAALHSEAFLQPGAAGRRLFAVGANPSWQDIYDYLNEDPPFPGVPRGNPGVGKRSDTESSEWDMACPRFLLGRSMTGAKQTIRETAKYYQQRGWEFTVA